MMSGHSVEKIGGTSMAATSTLFDNVLVAGRTGDDAADEGVDRVHHLGEHVDGQRLLGPLRARVLVEGEAPVGP